MSSRDSVRRFHFLRELGTGGFGSVFLAKVEHADGFSRLVAVKLLKNQWIDSKEIASRMRDEARLLGLLRHRNIVDVLDLTSIGGRVAVIMEYLEGADLRFVLRYLEQQNDRFSVRSVLEIGSAVASALDAAYNRPPFAGEKPLRVIHRDIKPNNIMLDDMGMTKVLDFGVARSELDSRESQTQELQFGSLEYMAPERLFFEPETPASDVYSLGATLFELLCGEKVGKARGRPERHTAFVDERLRHLVAVLGVKGMIASELESLLRSCLYFAHESRPLASEVSQKCRTLARIVDDNDLQTWAEQRLPAMIRLSEESETADNPLLQTSVTEDSVLVRLDGVGVRTPDMARSAEDGDALRRGALADLTASLDVEPNPASGSPGSQYADMDPPSAWDDEPTNVEAMPLQNDRSPLDVPTIPPLDEMEEPLMDATEVLARKLKSSAPLSSPLPISGSEGSQVGMGGDSVVPTPGNETPTEVVDATRLLELAAELQVEGTGESDEREITETDTTLGPGDSMDGGRATIPLMGDLSEATIDSENVPDPPQGPPQDETRPLMGLGHAQPSTPTAVPEPPVAYNNAPPPASPSSEWTDTAIEEPVTRQKGVFSMLLLGGFLVLGLAMMGLFIVVVVFQDRLAEEICQRGMSVSFIDCSEMEEEEFADDSPKDAIDRESTSQAQSQRTRSPQEEREEQTKSTAVEAPDTAPGLVFRFEDGALDQVDEFKLRCDDTDQVKGYWWANVDLATADSCTITIYPSHRNVTLTELSAGQYVCSVDGQTTPVCERQP